MESIRGLTSSPEHAYDELVTGQKSIRYHWQGILSVIRALPGEGLGERVESARRQLEESGATLNLLDNGRQTDRGKPSIRYHWQGILSVIRALPGGGLSERVESARRQLEESGATRQPARRSRRAALDVRSRCPSSSRPTNGRRSRPA